MLKNKLDGYTVVQYKWIVFARVIAVCFILVALFALTKTAMDWIKPAYASYASETVIPEAADGSAEVTPLAEEKVKPALMAWMRKRSEMPDEVLSSIYDAALTHANRDLILAICLVESNFNPKVKSNKGAIGLMGIMPNVWVEELKAEGIVSGRRDLFLIPNNIASGVYVIEKYMRIYHSLDRALFNYVGGDSSYVNKVLSALGEIHLINMVNVPGYKPHLRITGIYAGTKQREEAPEEAPDTTEQPG
jgi:soluble lytic murein transglycosylase-like protein